MPVTTDGTLEILLVEDNPGDARLFEHHLDSAGGEALLGVAVTHVQRLEAALEKLETDSYDLVLLDLGLPDSAGLDTLGRYFDAVDGNSAIESVPVVVLTGLKDEETSITAIERGAQDYLVKDEIDGSTLNRTVRHALERHQQQQRLRRQNDRLERFASVVSHDLRNPLNVAQTHIRMVENDEHAPQVERSLDRMEALIEDVLVLAREGNAVEETEQVDLARTAAKAWNQVETGTATFVSDDAIPMQADPGRCQQLFENLFRNSVEHSSTSNRAEPDDSVEHSDDGVTVRAGPLSDGFYVEDDGPGIPEDDRKEVFEPGYTTSDEGTGFGLNIVGEIAQAHGWTVTVTEGTDGGARFEFTDTDDLLR